MSTAEKQPGFLTPFCWCSFAGTLPRPVVFPTRPAFAGFWLVIDSAIEAKEQAFADEKV